MKVALLGKGKTGGKVLELLIEKNISHTVFDSKNPPTLFNLKGHDVIISFVSGEVFKSYLDILVLSKIPVISGTTGFNYPENFHEELKKKEIKWIYANNFSLGISIVYHMILVMKEARNLFNNYSFSLHEIHHEKKLDSPSGTALSFKIWADHEMQITSERIGDVIGIHELELNTPTEKISLKHEALDRKIFAEGALFAAEQIINNSEITFGLNQFQTIVEKIIFKNK